MRDRRYLLTVQILVSAPDEAAAFDFVDAILIDAQNGYGLDSVRLDSDPVFLAAVIKENKQTLRLHL